MHFAFIATALCFILSADNASANSALDAFNDYRDLKQSVEDLKVKLDSGFSDYRDLKQSVEDLKVNLDSVFLLAVNTGSSCNLDNTGQGQGGPDIKSYESIKWQCFADCMTDPGCAAATHNGETCWLHDINVPGNRFDSGNHSLFLKKCEVVGPRVEQWVHQVLNYSSQYNSDTWSASQVIGEPNVFPKYGDSRGTWTQSDLDSTEYLELKFQEKVYIKAVEIYETYHSGGVTKISAKTPTGSWVELWKTHAAVDMHFSRIFSPAITTPDFLSDVIRLDVDCTVAGTYVEIDAVKLIGNLPAQK